MKTEVEMINDGLPQLMKFKELEVGDFFGFPDRGNYVYQKTGADSYIHVQDGKTSYGQPVDPEHVVVRAYKLVVEVYWTKEAAEKSY
jgi:hypothetical protein